MSENARKETTPKPLSDREADELGNWLLQHLGQQDPKTVAVRKAIDRGDHYAAVNIMRGRDAA